jgi:uncharacterized oxidoreductase
MQMTGNTILITGGGSGIGRALAESFHALGNQVIIVGRRQGPLDETTAANPGMQALTLDIESPEAIKAFAAQLTQTFPALNAVIHNAGIMKPERLVSAPENLAAAESTITTNLLGPIRLNSALLPHLLKQPQATILTVSSGLAFLPMAPVPTYNATKAAIHSYSQTLRYQLKDTNVQVIEIVPPYVQTELLGPHQASDPNAMPLKEYISETMELLRSQPDAHEILVERVKPLRYAAGKNDGYDAFFNQFQERVANQAH